MVCVMLSDPALPHAPSPVPTLVATSLLAVLDVVRLDTLLRLHAVKWLCFLLLEVDHFVRAPGHGWVGGAGQVCGSAGGCGSAGVGALLPVASFRCVPPQHVLPRS